MTTLTSPPRASPTTRLPAVGQPAPTARDHISFSSVSLFQRCSLRYYFKYVAKLSEESVSSSLAFGRGVHRSIEFHFNELLAGNGPPDRDTLLAEFNDGWEEHPAGGQIAYSKKDTRDTLANLADRVLLAFQQSDVAQPSGRVLGVEEELRGQVIDGVPDVLARLDLLVQDTDGLTVTDFKTAKNSWTADQTTDSGEQLLLYSDLVRQRFPGWPIRLEFIVFKKAKTVTVGRHVVPLDAARLERTKRIIGRVWRSIQAGNFFPSPSPMNCGTCPFRDPCRRWSG